jgi:flavin reductase (DIM6/NTAB) family NADH-FMN oxidoreductase RutF
LVNNNTKQSIVHLKSNPAILYFGTPVVLISTKNPNGTDNLAPISSIFWLGWRCVIGIGAASQTAQNLKRSKQCVLNLPSADQVEAVNRLAKTTGAYPVPDSKKIKGYRYIENKFDVAGLTQETSETVRADRVKECPVQMEAVVKAIHGIGEEEEKQCGRIITFELKITRVYLDEAIILEGYPNRVDPDKWKPLIMSFQEFYTLGNKIHQSTLAEIPESLYNTPDRESALNN